MEQSFSFDTVDLPIAVIATDLEGRSAVVTVEDVLWSFETLGTEGHPRYQTAWAQVVTRWSRTLARKTDGTLWKWGHEIGTAPVQGHISGVVDVPNGRRAKPRRPRGRQAATGCRGNSSCSE